jgi:hypothetical protein
LWRDSSSRFGYAGILFLKIDVDLFPEVMEGAMSCLGEVLTCTSVVKGPQGHGPTRSDLVMLQLAVVAIYFADKYAGEGKDLG